MKTLFNVPILMNVKKNEALKSQKFEAKKIYDVEEDFYKTKFFDMLVSTGKATILDQKKKTLKVKQKNDNGAEFDVPESNILTF